MFRQLPFAKQLKTGRYDSRATARSHGTGRAVRPLRNAFERLEERRLLAILGFGVAGDSLSDEYAVETYDYAENWVELLAGAKGVEVVPLDAGWDDVGSWEAASRLTRESGREQSGHLILESPESTVFGDQRFVALVGLSGVTVVDTPEALLVVSNDRAEEVKKVVEHLQKQGRKDLL